MGGSSFYLLWITDSEIDVFFPVYEKLSDILFLFFFMVKLPYSNIDAVYDILEFLIEFVD